MKKHFYYQEILIEKIPSNYEIGTYGKYWFNYNGTKLQSPKLFYPSFLSNEITKEYQKSFRIEENFKSFKKRPYHISYHDNFFGTTYAFKINQDRENFKIIEKFEKITLIIDEKNI